MFEEKQMVDLQPDIHKKVCNFLKALDNLKTIEGKTPPYDAITEAGMVSLFEICFEQAWKAMKERLEFNGYGERKLGSPNAIIKLAFQAEMIDDEELWRAALRARNNVVHSYSDEIALSIIKDTQDKFIAMFDKLRKELIDNWL
ncbi:HI0074 family nucleotidyltransferase substrate-binding subunit [uncultured Anaerovibrio sp.]|uniref:HI0074 family nucleotidyltransferase substrate-binding subunit n=1 Tax=uncultured Anaerovibrio sp. TaxID=361586 RepID=UPI0026065021|nr:HI0074 family nucleotidyltransferase substrate-binding subunit [uncultured Anaerovibrio sp.]